MKDRTDRILDYFVELNTIPRCSKNEKGVALWLRAWADQRGFAHRTDAAGNLVIHVPASPGCAQRPTVIVQGHMDMVCEKTPESIHDFEKDVIPCLRNGDWLTARDTTLGADNGIAIAYALCLAEEADLIHPALELLFTVDEESGLSGVKNLSADDLAGKMLINLDSEDEGVFTIGCAGGADSVIHLDFETQKLDPQWLQAELVVGGLKGGHSGIDIHKQRANGNKILARLLASLAAVCTVRLIRIKGGSRHNAIPRDAQAVIAYAVQDAEKIELALQEEQTRLRAEVGSVESDLRVRLSPVETVLPLGLGGKIPLKPFFCYRGCPMPWPACRWRCLVLLKPPAIWRQSRLNKGT
jgi:dipeptidase D